MDRPTFFENLRKKAEEEMEPLWTEMSNITDRGMAIIAGCYLDSMLEKLIRASYIKNPQVNNLFKDDHILQSFHAKTNIAYFSGLIPNYVYHDIKLIGEIRNKFAHAIISDLNFTTEEIVTKIDNCELRPRTIDEYFEPRLKFVIIVSQIGAVLSVLAALASRVRTPHLMEIVPLTKAPYEEWALTKEQILEVLSKKETS